MKRKTKNQGITALKSRYGRMFTLPWLIGMIVFFIIPLFESIVFSFSEVTIIPGGTETKLIGFANYKEILFSNPDIGNTKNSFFIKNRPLRPNIQTPIRPIIKSQTLV